MFSIIFKHLSMLLARLPSATIPTGTYTNPQVKSVQDHFSF